MLDIWTLYDSPTDYPGQCVARRFAIVKGGAVVTDDVVIGADIETVKQLVQNLVPYVLEFIPRSDDDVPQIVGSLL